jgi:hypothetical protein
VSHKIVFSILTLLIFFYCHKHAWSVGGDQNLISLRTPLAKLPAVTTLTLAHLPFFFPKEVCFVQHLGSYKDTH